MSFEGKEILLTGGAGGLGGLISRLLTAEGGRVTVLDRTEPGGELRFMRQDLSTPDGIEAAAEAVAARDWDIIVNLAGIQHFGPLELQSPGHLMASYLVNLVAPVRLTQAALPKMKARKSGQIVNVGSIFGSINFAHFVTYSSAKAGLRGFSQALRRELSGSGIAVTYVAPRAVRTALNTSAVLEFAKLTHMNMDEPQLIAERIVDAIRARRRDAYFGFPEAIFVRLNAIFPGLVDRALSANDRKAARLFAR
ncbi:SDR family NAD(P)-dependent oxidoreductase [Phenylobacterium aquaticum]|uniref:SDR family NAD(P)-dependent oxidoreductase n=1 Tax=Phenylobacterium aquaticum TaxID=1763816 RepID=UPI001F5DCE99|nr:SDR family NAD(P)-dependent oxidoreductase [Phenylobacterium aquaticum]MCI3133766.1 SDR family NAD(P)-dependent oxidoreductase [Phenylobacterium aquaticum]